MSIEEIKRELSKLASKDWWDSRIKIELKKLIEKIEESIDSSSPS